MITPRQALSAGGIAACERENARLLYQKQPGIVVLIASAAGLSHSPLFMASFSYMTTRT